MSRTRPAQIRLSWGNPPVVLDYPVHYKPGHGDCATAPQADPAKCLPPEADESLPGWLPLPARAWYAYIGDEAGGEYGNDTI